MSRPNPWGRQLEEHSSDNLTESGRSNPWGRPIVEKQRRNPWSRPIAEATPKPDTLTSAPADREETALKAKLVEYYQRRFSGTIEGGMQFAESMAARMTREAIAEGQGRAGYLAKLREQAAWSGRQPSLTTATTPRAPLTEVKRIEEPWRPRSA